MIRRKCFLKHMFDRAIMTKADLLLLAVSCGAAVLFALLLALSAEGENGCGSFMTED